MSESLRTGLEKTTALHRAIAKDEVETVLELLSQPNTDLNEKDGYGYTPLTYSIIKRTNSRCVLALIDHGCDINITDSWQCTPLHYAAARRDSLITCKLIEKGAEVDAKNCDRATPLHYAVLTNSIENVHALLYYGACVDEKNVEKLTPFTIIFRCCVPNREITRTLLNFVVDFSERDVYGCTPLYYTMGTSFAQDIINRGANVNQTVGGNHCIYLSKDSEVFRAFWQRLNVDVLLKSEYLRAECFLKGFLYNNRFSDTDFLECLYMIFESPYIHDFVEHFHFSERRSDLMYHIFSNRFGLHGQTIKLTVASLLLSHGFEIYFKAVAHLYEKYGFCSCVELLLNNGSTIHQNDSVRDFCVSYMRLKVELMASKLCYNNFDIYSKVRDTELEVHKNEINRFRKFYRANFHFDEDSNLKISNSANRLYTVSEVPSLVELSRDLIRSVLYKKFSTIDYFRVYQNISYLRVPETIKDILRLKRPIYIIEDEELSALTD